MTTWIPWDGTPPAMGEGWYWTDCQAAGLMPLQWFDGGWIDDGFPPDRYHPTRLDPPVA